MKFDDFHTGLPADNRYTMVAMNKLFAIIFLCAISSLFISLSEARLNPKADDSTSPAATCSHELQSCKDEPKTPRDKS